MTDIEIVLATSDDIDRLGMVIAEAFFDLAVTRWLVGDETARREIMPAVFALGVERGLRSGVVLTNPDRTAVAVWVRRDAFSAEQAEAFGPLVTPTFDERMVAIVGGYIDRFTAFDTTTEAHHPTAPAHDWLEYLAVLPEHQGRGIGMALLNNRRGQSEYPEYLEAATIDNRGLYLCHGWTDVGSPMTLPPDGPDMFPMWREPRTTHVRATSITSVT
jgi:GNAT superfamily N-acetyltransferase